MGKETAKPQMIIEQQVAISTHKGNHLITLEHDTAVVSETEALVVATDWLRSQDNPLKYTLLQLRETEDNSSDHVELIAHHKSYIRRLRRITGYITEVGNFNEGKKAELEDRQNHKWKGVVAENEDAT